MSEYTWMFIKTTVFLLVILTIISLLMGCTVTIQNIRVYKKDEHFYKTDNDALEDMRKMA